MLISLHLFCPFRGCDGERSLHEPHGGAGLWSHWPGPGPPTPGRPGWAWAGAERASGSSQSLSTARVSSSRADILWDKPPLFIQTWAMSPPQSCLDVTPDSSGEQGRASRGGLVLNGFFLPPNQHSAVSMCTRIMYSLVYKIKVKEEMLKRGRQ